MLNSLTRTDFSLERTPKLRPVDLPPRAVYVCGLAHSPGPRECVLQGRAGRGRAANRTVQESAWKRPGTIARVTARFAPPAAFAKAVCAYGAVSVRRSVRGGTVRRAVVNDALCNGCGTCSTNCRCGAIDIGGFTDRQIINEIEFLLRRREVCS